MKYYVYFIEAGNRKNPPVKIGVTTNVENRIASLQTGNPYSLKCKALITCSSRGEAYGLESYLHYRLRKLRLNGEWFRSEYFKLKEILNDYGKKKDQKYRTKRLIFENYNDLRIKRMKKKFSRLLEENQKLRDENDNLLDQLESKEDLNSWMYR